MVRRCFPRGQHRQKSRNGNPGALVPPRPSRDNIPLLSTELLRAVGDYNITCEDSRGVPVRRPSNLPVHGLRLIGSSSDGTHAAARDAWFVVGLLGSGFFGTVFLVQDRVRGQMAAVKAIYCRGPHSMTSSRSLVMELRILELIGKNKDGNSFLLSPHTAAGRWAWQSFNGFAYVVTELCPGGDLSTRRRSLSPAQLQVIVAELVIGLEWLHDRDIVHHDIKPSNILIDGDGHCVISDFGGARMKIQDGPHQGMLCRTAKTDIVCTKPYAAPELVDPITFPRQTELYYTESIDYWSVGVTIVTLITGEELLTGNRKRREEELESVGERLLDVRVASDLVYLVYELLEPIPSRRWTGYWLKEHPYFDGIDWEEVMRKRHVPPFAQCRHARPRTNGRVLPQYEATHATDVNYLPVILQAEGLSIEKDDSLDLFEDCRDLQARMARAYDTYGPCSQ